MMKNLKILIFLHGTLIMHKNAEEKNREERVKQVIDGEPSVHDYASYIPVDNAVSKLKFWQSQDAEILYLSSHETAEEVKKDKIVFKTRISEPIFFRNICFGKNVAKKQFEF